LNLSSKNLTDLKGIELLSNLRKLFVGNNRLTELDVSGNPLLEELWVAINQLIELDVSGNPLLKELYVSFNYLTELDVSGNSLLKELEVPGNFFASRDDVIGRENVADFIYGTQRTPYCDYPPNEQGLGGDAGCTRMTNPSLDDLKQCRAIGGLVTAECSIRGCVSEGSLGYCQPNINPHTCTGKVFRTCPATYCDGPYSCNLITSTQRCIWFSAVVYSAADCTKLQDALCLYPDGKCQTTTNRACQLYGGTEITANKIVELCTPSSLLPQVTWNNHAVQIQNGIQLVAASGAVVEIYGVSGNLVSRQSFANGSHSLSLNHLPKGIYVAKVSFSGPGARTVTLNVTVI
jgi:hypothetical protein